MKEVVRSSFSRAAKRYRSHSHVQEAMAHWLSEWLPARPAGAALEVGAGPGVFTKYLRSWPGQLTASDYSAAMCEAGRRAVPEVDWRVMDAAAPDPGPWRWIFSSSLLQWMEDPDAVFAAWRRLLGKKSRILAGLFASESLPELRSLLGAEAPLVWRTPDEWTRIVEEAGFRVLRSETSERQFICTSARQFLRELHGVGAAPERRLSPPQLRRLLELYDARFRVEGGVRATWTFLRIEAERD